MFEFLIFIIPIIAGIWMFFRYKERNPEKSIVFALITGVAPVILGIAVFFLMRASNGESQEFHGAYVVSTSYYEPWNEMVTVTKTRTVPRGHRNVTETYTTHELRRHSEEFRYKDNLGNDKGISKQMFDEINQRMGNPEPVFRDMHRHYHTEDGDAYDRSFNGYDSCMFTLTYSESYWNPVKANPYTIFGYERMEKEEAGELGLFEYSDIEESDQKCLLGLDRPDIDRKIRELNARYGKVKQFRMYVLVFKDKGPEIAEQQKRYWCNGNKNEFIVCLGLNNRKISWCRAFSWADNPILEIRSRNWFREHPDVSDLLKYPDFIKSNLNEWKRKEFKDFDYLNVDLTPTQSWIFCILVIVFTMIAVVWIDLENRTC